MGIFSRNKNDYTIDGVRFEVRHNYDDGEGEPQACIDLLSLPTVANAIDIIADDIAQIPLYLLMRTDNGRERVRSKLAYRLYQQPNDYTNGYRFWKTAAMQMLASQAFILNRAGQFTLLPYGLTIAFTTIGGELRYAVIYSDEEVKKLGLDPKKTHVKEDYAYGEVAHLCVSQDEQGNTLPLRARFKKTFGLGSDIHRYTTNIYNKGGMISGYLSTDKVVNDTQKIGIIKGFKSLFKDSKATTGNDQRMGALDNGWKFNALNLTPQEMLMLESKKDFVRDVAGIFKLPLWKLGIVEDYHYSSAEHANRDYLQGTLAPHLSQIQREFNSKLFNEIERDYLYVEHNTDKLIQIDTKTKAEVIHSYLQDGVTSKDEARAMLNLDKVAGGEMHTVPVNVQSADYTQQAEALKIQKAALENAKLAAEVAAAQKALEVPAPAAEAEATVPAEATKAEPADEVKPLNGAQITAAVDVILKVSAGVLTRGTASELLLALGIDAGATERMLAGAAVAAPEKAAELQGLTVGTETAEAPETRAEAPAETEAAERLPVKDKGTAPERRSMTAAALAELQAGYVETLTAELLTDASDRAEVISRAVNAVIGQVATVYGLPSDKLSRFANAYAESAAKRLTGTETINVAYESNRLINAVNYEAIKTAYGSTAQVRWVGGSYDGQVRSVDEYWEGNYRHPPLKADDCGCHLELK